MRAALSILLLSISSILYAQNTDSLWRVWNDKAEPDSLRLQAMRDIAWEHMYSNPDSAFYYGDLELQYAKKVKSRKWEADAYNVQGVSKWVKSDIRVALEYFFKSQAIKRDIGDLKGTAGALNNIGVVYRELAEYDKAVEYYIKSLNIKKRLKDTAGIANTIHNIGLIYSIQKKYDKALEYYNNCLEQYVNMNREPGIAAAYTGIGEVYQMKKEYPKAIEFIDKGLKIFLKLEDKKRIAISYGHLGSCYKELNDMKKAYAYYMKAYNLDVEIGNKLGMIELSIHFGEWHKDKGEYTKVVDWCEKAFRNAVEMELIEKERDACNCLYEGYKGLGQYAKALNYQEIYYTLRDTLREKRHEKELVQREIQMEFATKAAADSVVHAELQKVKDAEIEAKNAKIERAETQRVALYGGLSLLVVFAVFMYNRFRITNNQKLIIEDQKALVESKNGEVMDSIRYARRIQHTILPFEKQMKAVLPDSFVLYKPKDIVSGDFYWMKSIGNEVMFSAVDCTGHGVPGAFMSIVGYFGLNRAVGEHGLTKPSDILDDLNNTVAESIGKNKESNVKDGMDLALCALNTKTLDIQYAGAHNPLYIVNDEGIQEIKANRQAIGEEHASGFDNHAVKLKKGDMIYITTDGYYDQFGGANGNKFMRKHFKELLMSIHKLPAEQQKEKLDKSIMNWMREGDEEQTDDICVFGIRV